MNRSRADVVVGVLLGFVLLAGGTLGWRAYQQRRAVEQSMSSMMGPSPGAMHGPDPLWYAFGTVLVVAAIGGVYLLIRGELTGSEETDYAERGDSDPSPSEPSASMDDGDTRERALNPESNPRARILDLLR